MSEPWLVVGLGNPGKEYAGNRHNVGFMVADVLAARVGAKFGRSKKSHADVAEGHLGFGGPKLILAKPLTYMNLSGGPVSQLAQFFKVPVENVVAVHDELDLPYGQVRAKRGGAPRSTRGSGSASDARPAGRTRPTTCSPTSARPSARSWSFSSIGRPMWRRRSCSRAWSGRRTNTTVLSPIWPEWIDRLDLFVGLSMP
jgi:hypothetical protein